MWFTWSSYGITRLLHTCKSPCDINLDQVSNKFLDILVDVINIGYEENKSH